MKNKVIRPFLFAEKTVTETNYLDMLQHYVVYQLLHGAIFQQDVALPDFTIKV